MANPRIVNWIDWDLELIRGHKSSGKMIHRFGFDPAAKFQRIGIQDRKMFTTVGGTLTGARFELRPAGICKIVAQDVTAKPGGGKQGLVTIEASAAGDCTLLLLDSAGKSLSEVSIHAVPQRHVVTRFYNLIDGKGRQGVNPLSGAVSPAALESLIDQVNAIVGTQCDVWMRKAGTGLLRDLTTTDDLGNRVDINKFNIFAQSDFDPTAEYHVLFVWAIDGGHANGITKSNTTILLASLTVEQRETTLAHEFVHFLSGSGIVAVSDHDSEKSDLLFRMAPHGINLRKDRLLKIIPK